MVIRDPVSNASAWPQAITWERGPNTRCRCGAESRNPTIEGLQVQQSQILKYAELFLTDAPLADVVGEVITGASEFSDREEAGKLLARMEPGDHLIVSALDRGWRDVLDFLITHKLLHERGIQMHLIRERIDTSTPYGKICGTLLVALAELERENIRDRTRQAMKWRRDRGYRTTKHPPVGYQWQQEGEFQIAVPHAGEQEVMAKLLMWKHYGWSWEDIVDQLAESGIMNKFGKPYTRRRLMDLYAAARKPEPVLTGG